MEGWVLNDLQRIGDRQHHNAGIDRSCKDHCAPLETTVNWLVIRFSNFNFTVAAKCQSNQEDEVDDVNAKVQPSYLRFIQLNTWESGACKALPPTIKTNVASKNKPTVGTKTHLLINLLLKIIILLL